MFYHRILTVLLFLICSSAFAAPPEQAKPKIVWGTWTEAAFERAAKENRLVLLDLEAVWCHWCHVMEETTYSDPKVVNIIAKRYVALRVDQATRPDLAARYEDFGWPATVILNSRGEDLWKGEGFIKPADFIAILENAAADPQSQKKVEPAVAVSSSSDDLLSEELRSELKSRHSKSQDKEIGGIKGVHRYLRSDTVDYALLRISQGEIDDREWVAKTLTSSLKLLDPAWGGMYQYSTRSSWDFPHYEKIMSTQTKSLESFVAGFLVLGDEAYLKAAQSIRLYLKNFLTSPEGAFYASQDADLIKGQHSGEYFALGDAARRAQGIPLVHKEIYARENGWAITALANLYSATAEDEVLSEALAAARWVQAHRALPGGGFAHGDNDSGGPFLGDNVAMLQAFLSLYRVTGDRGWYTSASQAAEYIISHFLERELSAKPVGILSAPKTASPIFRPVYQVDENVAVARAANTLFHYSGRQEFRDLAEAAMRYISQPNVALAYSTEPGVLIADSELTRDPLHITVVAQKDDPRGKELFVAGINYFAPYKRIEWWDKREGDLPRSDVQYPQLPKAAAFICTEKRCSLPIFEGPKLKLTIDLFKAKEKPVVSMNRQLSIP